MISGVNQKVNTVVSLEMNMFRFNHVNKNNGVPKKMCLTCIRKVCVCSIVLSNESKNPKYQTTTINDISTATAAARYTAHEY